MAKVIGLLLLSLTLNFCTGCAAKIPHTLVSEYAKLGTKLIAVVPVQSDSADRKAAEMLRDKLVEELYFKGYPKVPTRLIDERLAGNKTADGIKLSPASIGEILKVDAVLYATLKEGRIGKGLFYAPTTVDAEFEMRSAKTGESLWRVQYRIVYRHYGFSHRQMELKASQDYEPAIQEVVIKALSTLPDALDTDT